MRVALYSRVSTDSKNKAKRQETENQLLQLRAFAATQGWIVGREYVDRVTGGTADREQFQQM
jgi:DNA invertase Pin-like site-specific DNA recombinase